MGGVSRDMAKARIALSWELLTLGDGCMRVQYLLFLLFMYF